MPLPLTVSFFSKIQIVLPFWYWLIWVVSERGPLNGCVCVCVCVCACVCACVRAYVRACVRACLCVTWMFLSHCWFDVRKTSNLRSLAIQPVKTCAAYYLWFLPEYMEDPHSHRKRCLYLGREVLVTCVVSQERKFVILHSAVLDSVISKLQHIAVSDLFID